MRKKITLKSRIGVVRHSYSADDNTVKKTLLNAVENGVDLSGRIGISKYFCDDRGVNLRDADLRGVDLSYLDLRDADLRGADLSGSSLRGVNFAEADLRNTTFSNCILTDACFDGAKMDNAIMPINHQVLEFA